MCLEQLQKSLAMVVLEETYPCAGCFWETYAAIPCFGLISNCISVLHSFGFYRVEKIAKFIKFQEKEMEEFVLERDILIKSHEEKMIAMRRRHWEEEVELEKEFDGKLTELMEKYTPHHPEDSAKDQ